MEEDLLWQTSKIPGNSTNWVKVSTNKFCLETMKRLCINYKCCTSHGLTGF